LAAWSRACRDGVAAALVVGRVGVEQGTGAVVGADAGGGGHAWEDSRPRHAFRQDGPGAAGVEPTGDQDDGGAARAAALEEQPPAAADLDESGEVPIAIGGTRDRRGRALGPEDGDGRQQGGDRQRWEHGAKL
jgi:hypothetical protein